MKYPCSTFEIGRKHFGCLRAQRDKSPRTWDKWQFFRVLRSAWLHDPTGSQYCCTTFTFSYWYSMQIKKLARLNACGKSYGSLKLVEQIDGHKNYVDTVTFDRALLPNKFEFLKFFLPNNCPIYEDHFLIFSEFSVTITITTCPLLTEIDS